MEKENITIHVLDDGETWSGAGYEVTVTQDQYDRICAGEKPRDVVPDWDEVGGATDPATP
tara:strand:- start:2252 stop:2431 length:180 start_codon:yes stop_codon:yes gene_type:complete